MKSFNLDKENFPQAPQPYVALVAKTSPDVGKTVEEKADKTKDVPGRGTEVRVVEDATTVFLVTVFSVKGTIAMSNFLILGGGAWTQSNDAF